MDTVLTKLAEQWHHNTGPASIEASSADSR
jgi:hypothetical protein